MKQDSLEKSQSDLKKLRRKSQGKNANKYENKESEVSRYAGVQCRRGASRSILRPCEAGTHRDVRVLAGSGLQRETVCLYPCLVE